MKNFKFTWLICMSLCSLVINNTGLTADPYEAAAGTGLKGEYFDNINFTNFKETINNDDVNKNWGNTPPAGLNSIDTFSVRWSGVICPPDSGLFTFYIELGGTDESVRLWIDNEIVIDNKQTLKTNSVSGNKFLSPGVYHGIKIEYTQKENNAACIFKWESDNLEKQVVSTIFLHPQYPVTSYADKNFHVRFQEDFTEGSWWEENGNITFTVEQEQGILTSNMQDGEYGSIVRKQTALIPVNLTNFPILRIKVSDTDEETKWNLLLSKTFPLWSDPVIIQFDTNADQETLTCFDYNIPEITDWSGKERLQIQIYNLGDINKQVKIEFIQFGSYSSPPVSEEPFDLFVKIKATEIDASSHTYHFNAEGYKVWEDGKRETYSWTHYTFDFGDGSPVETGNNLDHTMQGLSPWTVTVYAENDDDTAFGMLRIGKKKAMYADLFAGYRNRQHSGRSDLWWWYTNDMKKNPWSLRPGDLYEENSTKTKQTISFNTPILDYYDQWHPATIEYTILLSMLVGIDGCAVEYQGNHHAGASLMDSMLPLAEKYGFKLTAHWIPASILAWDENKEIETREDMLEIGKDVMENLITNYILPTGATYRVNKNPKERPVLFLFNWNPDADETELPEDPAHFGYTAPEIAELRGKAQSINKGINPVILACTWSFWKDKWDSEKEDFPQSIAEAVDGLYGWIAPAIDPHNEQTNPDYQLYIETHGHSGKEDSDRIGSVEKNMVFLDRGYEEQERLINEGVLKVRGGTVFPGFDDPWNGAWNEGLRRYVPYQDENGTTIDQCFNRLIKYDVDIGLFATIADHAEGTTLEPTVEQGYTIAKNTAERNREWKGDVSYYLLDSLTEDYLQLTEDIYHLRMKYDSFKDAGFSNSELMRLKEKIDAVIPPLLTKDLALARKRLTSANNKVAKLNENLNKDLPEITLEWIDENKGACHSVQYYDLYKVDAPKGENAFILPEYFQRLIDKGTYKGTIEFEYFDNDLSWMAVKVNNLDQFESNVNDYCEIVKFLKGSTQAWKKARADFVAASFDKEFHDRADIIFQTQCSMAYINNFKHTANSLTIALHARFDSLTDSSEQNILLLLDPGTGIEVCKLRASGNDLEGFINIDGQLRKVTVEDALTENKWYHLAITWDGAMVKLYIDNQEKAALYNPGLLSQLANQILIGSYQYGMIGYIDDVQIYTDAKSDFTMIRTGNTEANLAGHWALNEGQDHRISDSSPNQCEGYFYNGTMWEGDETPPAITIENPFSIRLIGSPEAPELRKVTVNLKPKVKNDVYVEPFAHSWAEDFTDISDWQVDNIVELTPGSPCEFRIGTAENYGKVERKEVGYISFDIDRNPILRIDIAENPTGYWKVCVADVFTWEFFDVQEYTNGSGVFDYNLKEITDWSGRKIMQLQIWIEGGTDKAVSFNGMQIGRYVEIPELHIDSGG